MNTQKERILLGSFKEGKQSVLKIVRASFVKPALSAKFNSDPSSSPLRVVQDLEKESPPTAKKFEIVGPAFRLNDLDEPSVELHTDSTLTARVVPNGDAEAASVVAAFLAEKNGRTVEWLRVVPARLLPPDLPSRAAISGRIAAALRRQAELEGQQKKDQKSESELKAVAEELANAVAAEIYLKPVSVLRRLDTGEDDVSTLCYRFAFGPGAASTKWPIYATKAVLSAAVPLDFAAHHIIKSALASDSETMMGAFARLVSLVATDRDTSASSSSIAKRDDDSSKALALTAPVSACLSRPIIAERAINRVLLFNLQKPDGKGLIRYDNVLVLGAAGTGKKRLTHLLSSTVSAPCLFYTRRINPEIRALHAEDAAFVYLFDVDVKQSQKDWMNCWEKSTVMTSAMVDQFPTIGEFATTDWVAITDPNIDMAAVQRLGGQYYKDNLIGAELAAVADCLRILAIRRSRGESLALFIASSHAPRFNGEFADPYARLGFFGFSKEDEALHRDSLQKFDSHYDKDLRRSSDQQNNASGPPVAAKSSEPDTPPPLVDATEPPLVDITEACRRLEERHAAPPDLSESLKVAADHSRKHQKEAPLTASTPSKENTAQNAPDEWKPTDDSAVVIGAPRNNYEEFAAVRALVRLVARGTFALAVVHHGILPRDVKAEEAMSAVQNANLDDWEHTYLNSNIVSIRDAANLPPAVSNVDGDQFTSTWVVIANNQTALDIVARAIYRFGADKLSDEEIKVIFETLQSSIRRNDEARRVLCIAGDRDWQPNLASVSDFASQKLSSGRIIGWLSY